MCKKIGSMLFISIMGYACHGIMYHIFLYLGFAFAGYRQSAEELRGCTSAYYQISV